MKVAVCISGHLRSIDHGYENFQEVFIRSNPGYSFDFFIDTWDNLDWRNKNAFKDTSSIVPKVNKIYNPVQINIEKFIDWDTSKYMKYVLNKRWVKKGMNGKRSKGEHILGMYYKIFKCNNLKVEEEKKLDFKYDLVIRSRTDMSFASSLNLDDLKNIDKTIYVPQCDQVAKDGGIPIRDMFAISSSENMDYYCNLFNKIDEILRTTKVFRPEPMLYHHLNENPRINVSEIKNNWFISQRGK